MPSIKELIARSLDVSNDQITEDLSYGDLPEWDSLGHMNIMMALEEEFGIHITSEIITNLVNVKAITDYILDLKHE